ncbi:MAG: glycerate kinase [Oscillospiraceae bacterium]|nr:glycerate kinase [Oscillospiraceae bacterium]
MRKCVVVSDSFKGTLSSLQICSICSDHIRAVFPDCEVITLPVADGGEGTVDCFVSALGAVPVNAEVTGALGERTDAVYAVLDGTAFIEMSSAAGLPSVGDRKEPGIATTYGVGELIRDAVDRGCRKILLGLGGSATNDAGCGCAAALGTVFRDKEGREFVPTGDTLGLISEYDGSKTADLLSGVSVTAICDVRNPLYGPQGAAFVFAPQKGADGQEVLLLDEGLRHIGGLMQKESGKDVADIPGAGAAGGLGAGVVAFLGGELKPGIEAVLDVLDFDGIAADADLVITGEGKLDSQSFQGKVIDGVSKRTQRMGVPLIAVVGMEDGTADDPLGHGISAVFTTNRASLPFKELKSRAAEDYAATLDNILRLIQISEKTGGQS